MFPREKFYPIEEAEWFENGQRVTGTNVELFEKLLGGVFDGIPELADFDVVDWDAHDWDGNSASVALTHVLQNGYTMNVHFQYADGETSYFWGTLCDTNMEVVDELQWGSYDSFSDWVAQTLEQSAQMSLF